MKQKILIIILILFINSCNQGHSDSADLATASISVIFDDYQKFKDRINPIEATKGGIFEYNDFISNYISDDYQKDLIKKYNYFLGLLDNIDSTLLSEADLLSMKVMKWDCEVKLQGLQNPIVTITSPMYNLPSFELTPLTQVQSLHLYVAQLGAGGSVHPFNTVKDYEDWLSRLDDYIDFLDTSILNMKEGMTKNIVLPKVLIKKTIVQLDEFIKNPVNDHLFYRPIHSIPEEINQKEQNRLASEYRNIIENKLRPKYTELKQFLTDEYLPICRTTSGIQALPNGEETYKYLIKLHTTTNLTADQIHELGKKEVERILGEMEELSLIHI